MKSYYILILLFGMSTILMLDYMLVVAIGVAAKQFGATISFYEQVYPLIIGTILGLSIIGSTIVLLKHAAKQKRNVVSHNIISNGSLLMN